MNQTFSRAAPSAKYKKLAALYNKMNNQGETARNPPPEKVYPGDSLPVHALPIKVVIDTAGTRALLDYGAGKGLQYQWQNLTLSDGRTVPGLKLFWGVDSIACCDPAYPSFIAFPIGRFDGVISTDVLQDCAARPVEWWKLLIEKAAAMRSGFRFVLENKVRGLFFRTRFRTIVEG